MVKITVSVPTLDKVLLGLPLVNVLAIPPLKVSDFDPLPPIFALEETVINPDSLTAVVLLLLTSAPKLLTPVPLILIGLAML